MMQETKDLAGDDLNHFIINTEQFKIFIDFWLNCFKYSFSLDAFFSGSYVEISSVS